MILGDKDVYNQRKSREVFPRIRYPLLSIPWRSNLPADWQQASQSQGLGGEGGAMVEETLDGWFPHRNINARCSFIKGTVS
jgi:hypothetical protein